MNHQLAIIGGKATILLQAVVIAVVGITVSEALAQGKDGSTRISESLSQLIAGEPITIVSKSGEIQQRQFHSFNADANKITLTSDTSSESREVSEISRIEYERRRSLNPEEMVVSSIAGAAVGWLLGSLASTPGGVVGGASDTSQRKWSEEGALVGAIVGLAAGTLVPLLKKNTLVIEF